MTNNTDNQLDNKIKESLRDYLASKQAADWSRMESMLDASAPVSSFKWKYVINSLFAVVILGGGYLAFSLITGTNEPAKTEITAPAVTNETAKTTEVSNPISSEEPTIETETKTATNVSVTRNSAKNNSGAGSSYSPQSSQNNETENTSSQTEAKVTKPVQIMVMGNHPIFGDMLDSTKGIVGETKENADLQKAAVINAEKPIGWKMFINSDSLQKAHDQARKDSLNRTPKK